MINDDKKMRPIRSFVKREGRLTPAQRQSMEKNWAELGLSSTSGIIDFDQTFKRTAPRIVEIGFGMGASLLTMCQEAPHCDFIGIEVHRPGVGAFLIRVKELGLTNTRVYCEDAVEVLERCITDNSLDKIQIFFPDPWHKKRHHKRRLIQPKFIELLTQKLKPKGIIHLATDWENYAEHMMEVLSAQSNLQNTAGHHQFAPKPEERPLTKYEQRGQRLGHGVWDLVFAKH